VAVVAARVLTALAVAAGYRITASLALSSSMDKRRRHRVESVLRLAFLVVLGWVCVMTNQPFQVADRVRIDESKGDVIDVDYHVTTL
jgi:hypothetical protein